MAEASAAFDAAHRSWAAQSMLDALLLPEESVIELAAISGAIYWKGIAVGIVALAAFTRAPVLGVFFAVIAVSLFVMAFLTRRYLLLAATDQRIILRSGVFYQETVNLRYSRLESVELIHSPMGLLMGYGNVVITGTGKLRIMVPYVSGAASFVENATRQLIVREDAPQRVTLEGSAREV